ncbi:acetoacetate decarboxylase family protein [Actinoplanes sp. NPDC051494]|uniref:acetoacetate decarboxylase family protein n=1 Tax=Actinoplanes sp. NPDC051494 TaxID=3363907 RepID=UPI0037B243C8
MMYPPAPWHLRGQMYLSVFLVRTADLPPLPPGVRPLSIAGRVPVGAAWVDYEPGGSLDYRELLAAVLTRAALRPRVTITDIWVDSPASRDGGRELWAIPKELATLAISPPSAGAAGIGTADIAVRGRTLPGRWPTPMTLAQDGITTRVRGTAALRPARLTWHLDPAGALGWLSGRRPVFSLVLAAFRMRFG